MQRMQERDAACTDAKRRRRSVAAAGGRGLSVASHVKPLHAPASSPVAMARQKCVWSSVNCSPSSAVVLKGWAAPCTRAANLQ